MKDIYVLVETGVYTGSVVCSRSVAVIASVGRRSSSAQTTNAVETVMANDANVVVVGLLVLLLLLMVMIVVVVKMMVMIRCRNLSLNH